MLWNIAGYTIVITFHANYAFPHNASRVIDSRAATSRRIRASQTTFVPIHSRIVTIQPIYLRNINNYVYFDYSIITFWLHVVFSPE